jgi:U2 small nuclear ribonucleoprotein A'
MPLRTLQIMGIKSRTFDIPAPSTTTNGTVSGSDKSYRVKLTDKEKRRVEKLIREAKSLTEIARLEKEIAEGRIPRGEADEMEE